MAVAPIRVATERPASPRQASRAGVELPSSLDSLTFVRRIKEQRNPHRYVDLYRGADGRDYVYKPGDVQGHALEEVKADQGYRAMGYSVVASRTVPSERFPNDVAKLSLFLKDTVPLYEALESPRLGRPLKELVRRELAGIALMEEWDALSAPDNIRVNPNASALELMRVDTGGALRRRARGAPKGTDFDGLPMALWTLREPDRHFPARHRLVGSTPWATLMQELQRLLPKGEAVVKAYAGDADLQRTMAARFAAAEYLVKATDALRRGGYSDPEIDSLLRDAFDAERRGGKRVAISALG